jgi:hypothetical protein
MKSSIETKEIKHYVIFSYTENGYLSSTGTWVEFENATIFTQLQRNSYALPINCCYWVEVTETDPKAKLVVIDVYDGEPIITTCPDDVIIKIFIHNEKFEDNKNK